MLLVALLFLGLGYFLSWLFPLELAQASLLSGISAILISVLINTITRNPTDDEKKSPFHFIEDEIEEPTLVLKRKTKRRRT